MPINSFDDYPMSWKPKLASSDKPIYIRLANQLKEDIASGLIAPGTKLPPQRELADYLDINLSTVTRAFKLCEQSGIVCSSIGRGTYVTSDAATQQLILLSDPNEKKIEMGAILPEPDVNGLISSYLHQMTLEPDFYKLLQYGAIHYDDLQLKAACKWLDYSHVNASAGHVIFANGSQNAIFATLAALFKQGDRIATLPLTYPGFKVAAKILGIQLQALPLFEGKITLSSLEYVYKNHNIKGFYFIPDFNNPTCELMDRGTREMIAAFCTKHKLPIIEDGIYTLFNPNPLPPIATFVPEHSIFISSVSKILAPGLRLALVHAPSPYYEAIWQCLYAMQITPPALSMQLFTRLINAGTFDKIRALRIQSLIKRNALFDQLCPKLRTIGHPHSPIRWLLLPQDKAPSDFEKQAAMRHLQICSSDRFVVGNADVPYAARLSLISAHSLDDYQKGLSILNDLLLNT